MEKLELLCTVGRMIKCSLCGNSMEFPQKLKTELTRDLAIKFLGIYPKELKTGLQRDMNTHVHCSIIYNSQDMEAI